MRNKIIISIIAALIIIAVAYAAGIHQGRKLARQKCIDTVAENCEYICGVGKDFYFPDQQDRDPDPEPELFVDETAIAFNSNHRKGAAYEKNETPYPDEARH